MTSNNTTAPTINQVQQKIIQRQHRVIPMLQMHEGKMLHLPMVLMTGREASVVEMNAYQDTLEMFKGKAPKKDEPSNWDQLLDANRAYWTVFQTIRLPNDLTKKWFESKLQVEDTYNYDEVGILMNDYMTIRLNQLHLVNIDPNDPNAYQTMLDNIKKMGPEGDFFLNGFTTHTVNQFVKYLIAQLENLQKSSGSSGTPSSSIKKTGKIPTPSKNEKS
jgi:hypothetical protein